MFSSIANAQDNVLDSALTVPPEAMVDHGGNFPPFDSSFFGSHLFWLAISFAALYFLMARVIIPHIGSILEERRDRIASDLDHAAALKQEADAAAELYEKQLQQARADTSNIARAAMNEAKISSDRERATAEAAVAQRLAQAESQITAMQNQAMENVDKIATEITDTILSMIAGQKLDKSTLSKAVKMIAQN